MGDWCKIFHKSDHIGFKNKPTKDCELLRRMGVPAEPGNPCPTTLKPKGSFDRYDKPYQHTQSTRGAIDRARGPATDTSPACAPHLWRVPSRQRTRRVVAGVCVPWLRTLHLETRLSLQDRNLDPQPDVFRLRRTSRDFGRAHCVDV